MKEYNNDIERSLSFNYVQIPKIDNFEGKYTQDSE
jgi:hypothetical protein